MATEQTELSSERPGSGCGPHRAKESLAIRACDKGVSG